MGEKKVTKLSILSFEIPRQFLLYLACRAQIFLVFGRGVSLQPSPQRVYKEQRKAKRVLPLLSIVLVNVHLFVHGFGNLPQIETYMWHHYRLVTF